MKTQSVEEMVKAGATQEEAEKAFELFKILRPGLLVKRNGRIDTTWGDKTPLELYRAAMRLLA